MACERINVLNVPIDVCPLEDLEAVILSLLQKPGAKQIVFLTVWDLLKARRKNSFGECIRGADLVLPISKSIVKGAAFLKKTKPVRYNPFTTMLTTLTILEAHYKSFYLLGGRKKQLQIAAQNIRQTYPALQIVGRHAGYYPKSAENDLVTAISKASPSLVIMSDGVPDKVCWAYCRRNKFSSSIFIYYPEVVGIFSKAKKRIPNETFDKGWEIWREIFKNPFKIFLIFPYMKYKLLLLGYRLFKREKTQEVL
ncbi:MAG: WecB/TagA/CpsF family glycosyltransferase [Treponema sp.]|jgi:N-acetylglucosaminyldiphosphoundecaprenol N-acetyl-beta-D-mannosaminyltransferase|nr:WecB/TagA/CpsF family glycosyltransferase [Treponema sp.]